MVITGTILRRLGSTLPLARANEYADAFMRICPTYGINTADIFHEFIANVMHESGGLTRMQENLNYSSEALISQFGRHRISIEQARQFGRTASQPANQRMIANILYGGTWGRRNLGNTQPEDGWNFRGAGPIQLTGRAHFVGFTSFINKRLGTSHAMEQVAELMRTNVDIQVHSACYIFAVAMKLIDDAVEDDIEYINKKINGGTKGRKERIQIFELAKQLIK